MKLFGGKAWEAILKVKAHLMSEYAYSSGAGPVIFSCALSQYSVEQIQILFHFLWISFLRRYEIKAKSKNGDAKMRENPLVAVLNDRFFQ